MKYLFFDTRSLAFMRIAVALVIIVDLSIRISDLEVFYTNTGAVPLSMVFSYDWNNYFISLHTISGSMQVQFLLFIVAYSCAFLLLIGFRTRLFTILSWVMMVSLHNRNSLILQGGDDLLRMTLFWGMFLPWGQRYSYDYLKEKNELIKEIRNPAVFAYLLQICYIYTGSALLKGEEWSTDFSALHYVYSLDQIAYPVTQLFSKNTDLLRSLTAVAYYFELLVPLLFFIPVKHSFFRIAGVFLIILFHALNEFTLLIGLFPYIGMATCLGILPGSFMDKVENILSSVLPKIRIIIEKVGRNLEKIIPYKKQNYGQLGNSFLESGIIIFLIVFVFDWNYSNLSFVKSKLSDNLRFIGYTLRLDQSWGMFAPGVLKDDGWYIIKGETKGGAQFDLIHPGEKLTFDKPENITNHFKNDRWRKYYENLMLADHIFMRGYFCSYKTRIWNENHKDVPLKSLELIYMKEMSLPDYQYSKPEKISLWKCE